MCLQNSFYPLVTLKTGKRKVMFNFGFRVTDRESFEFIRQNTFEFKMAKYGYSSSSYLNKVYKSEDIERIEKMIQVPCGCCRECLADNSKQWAFRILKEAAQYENNYFVTITYNEDNIPNDRMLDKNFFTDFNKKLKTYLSRNGLKSDFRFC